MTQLLIRSRLARAATAVATSALALGLLAGPSPAHAVAAAHGLTTADLVPQPAPFGPDVSRWQHPAGARIDWARVRAAGSSFAIVKATEGSTYTNVYFAGDTAAARLNTLTVGAYHYARPMLPLWSASEQAQRFASVLGSVQTAATLPPILDLETTGGLTSGQLVTWAQIFTETLQAATGRTPMIYTYPSFWNVQMAGTSAFTRYPLWLATYRSVPPTPVGGWPALTLWQYTASAAVPGIVGDTDMSRFAGDSAALSAFADGTVVAPWFVTAPASPVRVRATAGVRSASVRWIPADDGGLLPSSYTVTASPGGAQLTVPGTSTTASVTGLTEGWTYSFTVTATNTVGASPPSQASVPVLARGDVPAAPAALGSSVGKGSVTLSWPQEQGATLATTYVLRRCSPAPCVPRTVVATVPVPAMTYVDTAVIGGVTYDYALAAANRWGSSRDSVTTEAMPAPTVDRLDAPTGLVAVGEKGAVRVAWSPVAFAARYQVLRCAGAACVPAGAPVATVDIPTSTLTQRVAAGSTYTYAVTAIAGPIASAPSRPATGTALIPQSLRVSLSEPAPRAGGPTRVTVRLIRTDTRAPLAGRKVVLSFFPARGAAPAPIALRTSAAGVASVVIRPQLNQVLAARSSGRDLLTVLARVSVRVKPVLGATLSARAAPRRATVTLSGRTSPLFYGERVFRQVWVRTSWRFVASAPIRRTGQFRFAVPAAPVPGTQAMRVVVGRTARHLGGASGQVKLTAR